MTGVSNHQNIVICGAGIVGCSTAYYIKQIQPLTKVTVIDRIGPASQASGKAGGFLAVGWESQQEFSSLTDLSFSLHRKLKKELTTDVGYRDLTTLSLNTNSCRDSKSGWILNRNKAEVLGTASNTGQVHPELLTKALLSQAQSKGAELILGCVQGVEFDEDGGVVGVKVFKNYPGDKQDHSVIKADKVVIALGPWTGNVGSWFPKTAGSKPFNNFHNERAHSVVIQSDSMPPAEAVFVDGGAGEGDGEVEIYPRPDGTVYSCGYSDSEPLPGDPKDVTFKPENCDKIVSDLHRLCPTLCKGDPGQSIVARQACYLPWSIDGRPVIGPINGYPNAFVASGHGCWGILNGSATGLCMASMILGKDPLIDMSPFSFDRLIQ